MKLAVVMTYYNEAETVEAAVAGLVSCETPFALYLVDDCSTKPPQTVLDAYQSKPWFHYTRNAVNKGPVYGLNLAIRQALEDGAELIAINDADDISYPNRLRDQLSAFNADPDLMIVGGGADMTEQTTDEILWRSHHAADDAGIRRYNRINSTFVHSTVMYRAEVFEKVGFYKEGTYALDYEMISRVLAAGCKAANVPSVVLRYNIRPGSMSVSKRRTQVASRLKVQLQHFDPTTIWSYWGVVRSALAYLSPNDAPTRTKAFFHRFKNAIES